MFAAGHNRLLHASGLNFADAGVGVPRVRLAAIQDYQRLRPRSQLKWNVPGCELPQPDGALRSAAELTGEERTTMQWHHDVLELAPYAPVDSSVGDFPDMWKDWSELLCSARGPTSPATFAYSFSCDL